MKLKTATEEETALFIQLLVALNNDGVSSFDIKHFGLNQRNLDIAKEYFLYKIPVKHIVYGPTLDYDKYPNGRYGMYASNTTTILRKILEVARLYAKDPPAKVPA